MHIFHPLMIWYTTRIFMGRGAEGVDGVAVNSERCLKWGGGGH